MNKPLPFLKAAIDKAAIDVVRKHAKSAGAVLRGIKAFQEFVADVAKVRRKPSTATGALKLIAEWQDAARVLVKQYPPVEDTQLDVDNLEIMDWGAPINVVQRVEELRQRMFPVELKTIRKNFRISQKKFAKVIGVHLSTLSRWERGKLECKGEIAQMIRTRVLDSLKAEIRKVHFDGK